MVYLEHRCYLPLADPLRNDTKNFELGGPPALKNMAFIDKYNGMYTAAEKEKDRKEVVRASGCKGSCAMRSLHGHDQLLGTNQCKTLFKLCDVIHLALQSP